MRIGFTGSRRGMSLEQEKVLFFLLNAFKITEFHHGDCVGADKRAHELARDARFAGIYIVIHPPSVGTMRAGCKAPKILPAKDYLRRNDDIVDSCDLLIATPLQEHSAPGSGTWYTVAYAQRIGKPTLIIFPDGSLKLKL